MPVLNDLAREYGNKPVVVLAINVEGSATSYREFIREHDYPYLQWARDSSGQIARDYRVRGIPLTYILDDQGVVRHVHVGYGSGLGKTLAREIEALLP